MLHELHIMEETMEEEEEEDTWFATSEASNKDDEPDWTVLIWLQAIHCNEYCSQEQFILHG
jgi:hypothetical protein